MEVDKTNEKKYWLTGSQKFDLMRNISESLAGRVAILEMSSLSFTEKKVLNLNYSTLQILKINIIFSLMKYLKVFTKVACQNTLNDNLDRNQFFNDYILTYLERDVRALSGIGDLTRFRK